LFLYINLANPACCCAGKAGSRAVWQQKHCWGAESYMHIVPHVYGQSLAIMLTGLWPLSATFKWGHISLHMKCAGYFSFVYVSD